MSETKKKPLTDLRTYICPDEGRLNRAAELSAGFRVDLRTICGAVARGTFSPNHGVETMKLEGGLTVKQELQLTACLGRIAAGECPSYPLLYFQGAEFLAQE